MASRIKLARAGAAVVGASVALMMSAALPAGAEQVSGTVDSASDIAGYNVNVGNGKRKNIKAHLIGFKLADGTKLKMYCVEIDTDINKKNGMVEQPWDAYPNPDSPFHENRDKINWVLHHGYPVVATDALTTLLTGQGTTLVNGIDEKEAIAATQAAVWHYSDGTALNEGNPLPNGPEDAKSDVLALYKYLTGAANVGRADQPTPALSVSPDKLTGEAGQLIGPFTVATTGDIDKLTSKLPEGVKITDADGNELAAEAIKDGAQLFLSVPEGMADGDGTFELSGSASVDTGRLFVTENYAKNKGQSLIVATAGRSEVTASAGASWVKGEVVQPPTTTTTTQPTTTTTQPAAPTTETTPAPQPKNTAGELAETGASIFAPIVIGVVLIGAGVGALLFLRHRRRV